jgi:type IX secretion system PorP/SprF family membrane protein
MRKQLIISIFLIALIRIPLSAQDFHFSQFFVLPAFLNPAYIGKFGTDYRVGLIHRRQWVQLNTPYTTSGATAEINFRLGPLKYDLLGIGLSFVNDELGNGGYKNQYIIVSGAYHRYLDEFLRHRISGGAQFSYVRKNISTDNYFFSDQIVNYKPDFTRTSGDNVSGNTFQYVNINVGLAYNFKVSEKFEFETGVSFFNVARPTETTIGVTYKLPMRFVWNAMLGFRLSRTISVTPQLIYMYQGQAQDAVVGGMLGYHFRGSMKPVLYLGGFYRNKESVIPTAGFAYKNFYFGVSYDVVSGGPREIINNVSVINQTTLGSLEFTLIYNGFLKRALPGKLTVPCGFL